MVHTTAAGSGQSQSEAEQLAWLDLNMAELADHIEATHHAYLREVLPRLGAMASKLAEQHGADDANLLRVCSVYAELRADLEPHLLKEELMLFPMIRQLATAESMPAFHCGSVGNPMRVMLFEHDRAVELLAELRLLTGDYLPPADACSTRQAFCTGLAELEADTLLHIRKENETLFPAAIAAEQRFGSS